MQFLRVALVATLLAGCGEEATSPSTDEQATPSLSTAAGALSFRQVSAGREHTCGVTTDNLAYCWGLANYGQLGNGSVEGPEECNTYPCSSKPLAVVGGLRFRSVSAGDRHTCGVTTENRAYCWGRGSEGQLGDGKLIWSNPSPVAVAGTRRFREVSVGGEHTCGITVTDLALCWGANYRGELGDGTTSNRASPVRVLGGLTWRQLSAGASHNCGLTTTGRAYCWGQNSNGQAGNGSTAARILKPAAVSGGLSFRQIAAGFNHSCAVTSTDYRAYCWGTNGGALGDGTTTNRLTPTAVADTRRFDHVSAGIGHTCGVTRTARGVCWGTNGNGQLGNGTTYRRATPTPVAGSLVFAQVSAGFGFSCAVTTESRAYCWGTNYSGQIGDGAGTSKSQYLVPNEVVQPT